MHEMKPPCLSRLWQKCPFATRVGLLLAFMWTSVETQAWGQRIGEIRKRTPIELVVRVGNTDGWTTKDGMYSPPSGWVVVDYQVHTVAKFGHYTKSVDAVPKAFDYRAFEQTLSQYDSAIRAMARAGNENARASLKEARNNFEQINRRYSSSHRLIRARVQAKGEGVFGGGGKMHIKVHVTEQFVGDVESVRQTIRSVTGNTRPNSSNRPRPNATRPSGKQIFYTIRNDSGKTVTFRLPSGRDYSLRPGQTGSYRNKIEPGRPNELVVVGDYRTGRRERFPLRSGNYRLVHVSAYRRPRLERIRD